MYYIITANVAKDYGYYANAVIAITKNEEKAEELINSISNPEYPCDFDEIDGYSIYNPKIIEIEDLNTLHVCLSEEGLDYSDS